MPTYGKVKVNTLTYDSSGSAVDLAVGDIAPKADPTFTGTINGATAVLTGNLTVDTNTLHVDATNNRVGIGTTSPSTLLTLDHATNPSIHLKDSGTKVLSFNAESTQSNIASFEGYPIVFACSGSSAFTERMRIGSSGQLGIAGANYGSDGQVLTSGGASAAPSWTTIAGGLSSDAQKNTVGGTNAGDSFTGTDANDNTLIGYDAGTDITSGDKNTALGVRACEGVSTGFHNTAIGYEALCANGGDHTGSVNTALGSNSLFECRSGTKNVAVGSSTLKELTTGTESVAVGAYAGMEAKGNNNTYVGYYAGKSASNAGTGNNNSAVGSSAGSNLSSGSNNTFLGHQAGTGNSPSGNVTTGSNTVCLGDNSVHSLYCATTSISSSDKRDKTDVADFTHGLKWINQLKPVTYRWDRRAWYEEYNEDGSLKAAGTPDGSKKRARQHLGFLAQDVLAIEEADGYASKKDDMLVVNLNEDDTGYGLMYDRLIPVLVNAIKELSTEVNTLKTKVAALEAA